MTLHLSAEDVRALATHEVTMAAARAAVAAERDGDVALPPRLDLDLPQGFLRVMPAALGDVMGLKVMTLVRGVGNRYLILLYSQATGELVAVLDADEVTRLRTAATTAVAAELLARDGPTRLGIVGSGFEAKGHLRALASIWPLEQALVFSPSAERRAAFARLMTEELGFDVRPVASASAAIGKPPVSVLATKATEPVVDGSAFPAGATVLSIGSTRPDLRELDRATLRRAGTLLVDNRRQVLLESGDVIDGVACGALGEEHMVSMAEAAAAPSRIQGADGRDLLVFKSVGTALQDLALSRALVEAARREGRGRDVGDLTRLKAATGNGGGGAGGVRAVAP
jgi:alanine dehydrogenase